MALAIPIVAEVWMLASSSGRIYEDVSSVPKHDAAIVLGAGVLFNGEPSLMLKARLDKAIELYKFRKVKKLLVSGDNSMVEYNEPKCMAEYAIKHGVPAEDVVRDYAGRRTYDTVYRAKHIFGLKDAVVISQQYHLPRTVFLARSVGLDVVGLDAPSSSTNWKHEIREMIADVGALFDVYCHTPKPIMGKREKML